MMTATVQAIRFFRKTRMLVLAAALVFGVLQLPFSVGAQEDKTYFDPLTKKLIADGFKEDSIRTIYQRPQVQFDIYIVSRYFSHREARLNYDQFTTWRAIGKARRYMEKYQADLDKAQAAYGVDKEVITAIMLVETQLGTVTGGNSVLNSLSTLAALSDEKVREGVWKKISNPINLAREDFDAWSARKSKWAYLELKALLKYTEREKMDPSEIQGSFAGALGIAQFMPSNILVYAQDGNADGRIDLFDHADAIASIASYLKHYGWVPGIERQKAFKVVYRYNHSKYYVNTVLKIVDKLKD